MIMRWFFTAVMVCAVAAPADAGIDEAINAYNERDYKFALKEFSHLAEAGDNVARTYLGNMYFAGYYVPPDQPKVVELYRSAADQGHVPAQIILGKIYHAGNGVPRDYLEGTKWFRLAADQGRLDAQMILADLYAHSPDLADAAEAAKWYHLAADQGEASAQYSLGLMYLEGKGVSKSFVQAHKWLHLASVNSSTSYLSDSYAMLRDEASAEMTPEQLAKARQLAQEWKPTSDE